METNYWYSIRYSYYISKMKGELKNSTPCSEETVLFLGFMGIKSYYSLLLLLLLCVPVEAEAVRTPGNKALTSAVG